MPRRNKEDWYDRGYWNHRQAIEEDEHARIEWIKDHPRYKTRKEYEDAFAKLDEKFDANSMEAQMHIEDDTDAQDWDFVALQREDLEEEYKDLYEEYDLIYGEHVKKYMEKEMDRIWNDILYYDVHNKELANRYRKQYDDYYAEYTRKFLWI